MPRPKTDNIRINLFMEPKVLTAMKALAQKRGTTYSELVRNACREFAVRELRLEKQARQPPHPIEEQSNG